jgi:hypothetical protein
MIAVGMADEDGINRAEPAVRAAPTVFPGS